MSYKYTETEYTMLDNLLEPVYTYSMTHSKINEILIELGKKPIDWQIKNI